MKLRSYELRRKAGLTVISMGMATFAGGLAYTAAQGGTEFTPQKQERSILGALTGMGGVLLVGAGATLHPPRIQSAEQKPPKPPEITNNPPNFDIVALPDQPIAGSVEQPKPPEEVI